MAAQRRLQLDA